MDNPFELLLSEIRNNTIQVLALRNEILGAMTKIRPGEKPRDLGYAAQKSEQKDISTEKMPINAN